MVSFSIVDFVANNLLDEVGLNPTWEKVRKYLYAAGVGISLFTLYLTLGLDVECVLTYPNGTVVRGEVSSTHVNEYCKNTDSMLLIRYSGCIFVGFNAIIMGVVPCWLCSPKVIDPLRTFTKIQELFDDIQLPLERMKTLASTPIKEEESLKSAASDSEKCKKKLRQLLRLLSKLKKTSLEISTKSGCHRCYLDMPKSYTTRSLLLVSIIAIAVVASIFFAIMMDWHGALFRCTYDLTATHEIYVCTIDSALAIVACNVIIAIMFVLQLIPITCGLVKVRKLMKTCSTEEGGFHDPLIKFILSLWKSSKPSKSGLMSEFIEQYLFSGKFYRDVIHEGVEKDPELTELARFLERAKGPFSELTSKSRNYNAKYFKNIITKSKYKLGDCVSLAALLTKHEVWETLVVLLEGAQDLASFNDVDIKRFENIKVNFDTLASADTEVKRLTNDFYDKEAAVSSSSTHSLLYHASDMTKRKNLNVAIFLLACFKPPTPYVHYVLGRRHISEPADRYFKSKIYHSYMNYDKLMSAITECNIRPTVNFRCQHVLQDEFEKYESMHNDERSINPSFSEVIARRKFRIWDANASDFLESAINNKHEIVAIALFHAYFPGNPIGDLFHQESIPNTECSVRIFRHFEYELDDCMDLVKYLVQHKSWQNLVGLLYNTETRCDAMTETQRKAFKELTIDYESPEIPGSDNQPNNTNIIYEAMHPEYSLPVGKDIHLAVANLLLDTAKPQILYVFDEYFRKTSLAQYLKNTELPYLQSTPIAKEEFRKFKVSLTDFEMKYMYDEYERRSCDLEMIIKHIANEPLINWNKTVLDFANLTVRNEHWRILTSILSTYVVENEKSGYNVSYAIDINGLDDVELIWNYITASSKSDGVEAVHYVIKRYPGHRQEIVSRLDTLEETYFIELKKFVQSLELLESEPTPLLKGIGSIHQWR